MSFPVKTGIVKATYNRLKYHLQITQPSSIKREEAEAMNNSLVKASITRRRSKHFLETFSKQPAQRKSTTKIS